MGIAVQSADDAVVTFVTGKNDGRNRLTIEIRSNFRPASTCAFALIVPDHSPSTMFRGSGQERSYSGFCGAVEGLMVRDRRGI
jgi:hypothetical protein